jgi:hypothetical protein
MERESLRFLCPERADIVLGREALAGFEPPAGILNADEIGQVASESWVSWWSRLTVASLMVRFTRWT